MSIIKLEDIFNTPLLNLIHVNRYSGTRLLTKESVSDHIWGMKCLALTIVPKLNKFMKDKNNYLIDYFDLKEILYRIDIHDLDESLSCDIPRPFKYFNKDITRVINSVVFEMLHKNFDDELVHDILTAKKYSTDEGYLVAVFDTMQAGMKMIDEIELGNSKIRMELRNVIDGLNRALDNTPIDHEDMKYEVNKFILNFMNYADIYLKNQEKERL